MDTQRAVELLNLENNMYLEREFLKAGIGSKNIEDLRNMLIKDPNAYIGVIRIEAVRVDTYLSSNPIDRGIPVECITHAKRYVKSIYHRCSCLTKLIKEIKLWT